MGVPITVYLFMAESSVLSVSKCGVMQVSSVCWVGVRIGLCSGREAEGQTDATWCWGVPGARAVSDRLSWRWLIRINRPDQKSQRGVSFSVRRLGALKAGDHGEQCRCRQDLALSSRR